jgi:glycosyltransferase involved in cell wall biosynthesis
MLDPEVGQIVSDIGPVVHVISDAGPHPYFRTLIEGGGMPRESLVVGCVGSEGALQRDMRELGVRTFALGADTRSDFPRAVARLQHLLRRNRTQIVQSHLVDGSLVGLAAARIARRPVVVFTAHHSHELPFHGQKLVWVDKLCAGPLCDHVIAPSLDVAEVLVKFARIDRAKIEVVHHGFDLERLNPARVDSAELRDELDLGSGPVLGAIGRIYALKNYEKLLRAFGSAAPQDAALVIVGPGDSRGLKRLAAELDIADRIRFTGPRSDIPELLSAFDVFVHPAVAESFGMVIIEAMAMGKPVLSTPVGIAREVVEAGVTGILACDASAEGISAALSATFAMRARWPQIGQAAHDRVAGFTAQAMAARYASLYRVWSAASAPPAS